MKKYKTGQNLIYWARAVCEEYPQLLGFCVMAVLVNCIVPLLTAFLPKVVIEMITGKEEMKVLLLWTGGMTFALAVFSGLQKYLGQLIYWHKFKMNTYFLRKVTKKGLTTDYCNTVDEQFRKLQQESFSSCNGNFSYFNQICETVVRFFSDLLGLAAFMGILALLNPFFIVFLVSTTLIGCVLNRRVTKWLEKNMDEKSGYEQRMQYVISAANDVRSAKDIRLYNMSVWLNKIYEENLKSVTAWYRKYTAKLFGVAAADSIMTFIREGVTYIFLIYMVCKGQITVAEFVLYFNVVAVFSAWLGSLLGQLGDIERLNMSVNRFRAFLDFPEHYLREAGKSIRDKVSPSVIELKDVCFKYDKDGEDIIKHLDLKLEEGEHLAVVGLNGAGKTTLMRLITGLTEASSGTVFYDGVDIREYNRNDYYKLFGAVFQDHSILPVTIEEIVSEADAENTDEELVKECLNKSGLLDKVQALNDGIKSHFDKAFWDDGINFSGGEIQKLMIARALYRNCPVIILDEPTAALDPVSENRLYETYDEVMKGRSTIFISHRLASTRFCSRIVLIDGGRIIEEGTHEELLKRKGRYYELFETQAKYYREETNETEETF